MSKTKYHLSLVPYKQAGKCRLTRRTHEPIATCVERTPRYFCTNTENNPDISGIKQRFFGIPNKFHCILLGMSTTGKQSFFFRLQDRNASLLLWTVCLQGPNISSAKNSFFKVSFNKFLVCCLLYEL